MQQISLSDSPPQLHERRFMMAGPDPRQGSDSPAAGKPSGRPESIQQEATDAARATGEYARQQAGELAAEAGAKAKSLAEEQKNALAEQLGGVVEALRTSARQLRQQDQSSAARYAEWAADGLGGLSRNLQRKDFGSLVSEAERYARRQPAVFLGGAIAAGFVLSRFLKSSSTRAHTPEYSAPDYGADAAVPPVAGVSSTEPLVRTTPPGAPGAGGPDAID
jgi:hypothetical protein